MISANRLVFAGHSIGATPLLTPIPRSCELAVRDLAPKAAAPLRIASINKAANLVPPEVPIWRFICVLPSPSRACCSDDLRDPLTSHQTQADRSKCSLT